MSVQSSDTLAIDNKEQREPREALILTAVQFLVNPKLAHMSVLPKQQFLRSKGLTEHEIQLACERAGVFTNDPSTVINMGFSTQTTHSALALQTRPNVLSRLREWLFLGGIAYAVYLIWRKYIEPYFFVRIKKKPIDESLAEMDQKVDARLAEINQEVVQLKDAINTQQNEQTKAMERDFGGFRSELEIIKGLLLNRKAFETTRATAPTSIPAWQLASSPHQHHHHHHRHSQSDDIEKADDVGSGSGSSETEVVTKNSDSSLEIM